MKLHAQAPSLTKLVTGYGADYIEINRVRHGGPVIVSADTVVPWKLAAPPALAAADLLALLDFAPEIVVVGTGSRLVHLPGAVLAPLVAAGVAFEYMDTAAACRTYNILQSEGRRALGAFLSLSGASTTTGSPP